MAPQRRRQRTGEVDGVDAGQQMDVAGGVVLRQGEADRLQGAVEQRRVGPVDGIGSGALGQRNPGQHLAVAAGARAAGCGTAGRASMPSAARRS